MQTPQFLVFPSDDDFESVTPSDVLNGPALEAVLTHTYSEAALPIPTPPVYDFLEPPTCECGCGERIRGKQRFASTACQVRVWRAEHPKAPEVRRPEVAVCQSCLGWKLGDGEAFICESCADKDPERSRSGYAPLLRLALRPDNPLRDVMVYIGTGNYVTYRRGDEHEIVALDEPLIERLVEVLGGRKEGRKFLMPTAALVAEAEKQKEARSGSLPKGGPVTTHSEKDAAAHAAVIRDREVWGSQPVSAALLARQGTDSQEHNERTATKYAALAHEQPELFE
jgi:hypothetical protein